MKRAAAAWMRLGAVGVAVVASVPMVASSASAADTVYTMADVQKHATAADCWSAINGSVYNLTDWVNQHPGGSNAIIRLCGTDGSRSFNSTHGTSSRPAAALAGFKIGVLDGASAPAPSTPTTSTVPAGSYTMRDVHQHRRIDDCWSAISGNVYNMTDWIKAQPLSNKDAAEQNRGRHGQGGARQICGHDGTRSFYRITGGKVDPTTQTGVVLMGPLVAGPGHGGKGLGSRDDDGDDDRAGVLSDDDGSDSQGDDDANESDDD
jgi:cytochrome b involved in lipid metabolism